MGFEYESYTQTGVELVIVEQTFPVTVVILGEKIDIGFLTHFP